MKAAAFEKTGGLEVLELREVPTPTPGPGEVQVRIAAAALNHLDLWVRRGLTGLHLEMPHWTGADGAGTISAAGPGTKGVKEGDAVVVNPVLSCGRCRDCLTGRDTICREFGLVGEHRRGCLAEYIVVPQQNVVPAPKGVDTKVLAALPTTYMTAWQMLVERARIQPGDLVLVWAAGSGVGVAATQIAKMI